MYKRLLPLFFLLFFAAASPVSALTAKDLLGNVKDVAKQTYQPVESDDPGSVLAVIGNVVNLAIGVLGVVAVLLFIYAGFLWMTAGGNEDQIKKAKNIMKAVIIGLIIISVAYILIQYVSGLVTSEPVRSRG